MTNGTGNISQVDATPAHLKLHRRWLCKRNLLRFHHRIGRHGHRYILQRSEAQCRASGVRQCRQSSGPAGAGKQRLRNELLAGGTSASIGTSGTAGLGTMQDGALEASNVNISAEFSDLIIAQRAFEANSKAVTTFDTVTQETINMIH